LVVSLRNFAFPTKKNPPGAKSPSRILGLSSSSAGASRPRSLRIYTHTGTGTRLLTQHRPPTDAPLPFPLTYQRPHLPAHRNIRRRVLPAPRAHHRPPPSRPGLPARNDRRRRAGLVPERALLARALPRAHGRVPRAHHGRRPRLQAPALRAAPPPRAALAQDALRVRGRAARERGGRARGCCWRGPSVRSLNNPSFFF
jgi:hypothetical protein